jgi:hypothetical protein
MELTAILVVTFRLFNDVHQLQVLYAIKCHGKKIMDE